MTTPRIDHPRFMPWPPIHFRKMTPGWIGWMTNQDPPICMGINQQLQDPCLEHMPRMSHRFLHGMFKMYALSRKSLDRWIPALVPWMVTVYRHWACRPCLQAMPHKLRWCRAWWRDQWPAKPWAFSVSCARPKEASQASARKHPCWCAAGER